MLKLTFFLKLLLNLNKKISHSLLLTDREDLEDVDVWIGLNDLDKYNYYQWVDGSPVSYTKWSFNEPDGGVS